jgi:peroxiredoxin family protein
MVSSILQNSGDLMDLSKAASVATVAEAVVVAVSVFFIWRQIKQQTKLAKVANTQALVELSSPFNLQLIQDREMAEFWVKGARKFDTYDQVDQYRYKSLLIWWLLLHENIYYQKQNKLLDEKIYASWLYDLTFFVHQQQLKLRWEELKDAFQSDFRDHVDSLIENPPQAKPSSRTYAIN